MEPQPPESLLFPTDRNAGFFATAILAVLLGAVIPLILLSAGLGVGTLLTVIICLVLATVFAYMAHVMSAPAPRILRGTELIMSAPLRPRRCIDLASVHEAAITRSTWSPANRFGPSVLQWSVLLAHPAGRRFSPEHLRSMGFTRTDVDRWQRNGTLFVAVNLAEEPGYIGTREITRIVRDAGALLHPSVPAVLTRLRAELRPETTTTHPA